MFIGHFLPSLVMQPLLPIGYVQHASFPYAAVKDHDLSKKHASDSKTYQVGEENSELRIIPEVLVHPAGEPAPQTVQAHQVKPCHLAKTSE